VAIRLTPAGWRRLAALAVGLALLYAAFEYGRSVAGYSALSSLMQRQALASRVGQLDEQRLQLERRLAAREVAGRVDAEAQSEVQAMIGELQAELARQQQELDFYRGLVAEKFGTGTIKVQELTVRPAEPGRFTVLVTLVHSAARDSTATGSLSLTITGSRAGALARLGLAELTEDRRSRVDFSLRYLTTVPIPVVVPAGFTPAAIDLELRSSRGGPDPVRQTFPWSGVIAAEPEAALTRGIPPE
jgi:hypothetical protein